MANALVSTAPPIVTRVAPVSYKGEKYAKIYRNLGITQILLGSLSILFGIIAIAIASNASNGVFSSLTYVSCGIWCGILVFIAGILGVISGRKPEPCPITAALIMTIFAAIASGLMFAIETPAAVYAGTYHNLYYRYSYGYSYYPQKQSGSQKALTAFHAMLSMIAFVQFVIAIVHSAYCCAVNCCGSTTGTVMAPQRTVIATTATTVPGQIPHATILGQSTQHGLAPTQYVIQSQPGVIPQAGYQTIQQNPPTYPQTYDYQQKQPL